MTFPVGLSFISKTQVLGKGPKCFLSCTIPALDRHLSNGMAKDRLLCPVRALRYYLEMSMAWRENKRLLFVSFKPGHKRDIVPSTISGWLRKTIMECFKHSPAPHLESHRLKAHQVRSMAASLPSTDRHPWSRYYKLVPDVVIMAAEFILPPTDLQTQLYLYPPSVHLDSALCEATEPG